MTGQSFCVSDYNLICRRTKDMTQSINFCRGASPPGRCISFMRHKYGLWCQLITIDSPAIFCRRNELFHYIFNMIDIQACTMESTICCNCSQYISNWRDTTSGCRRFTFHHQWCTSHSNNHTVTTAIKWNRGIFHKLICSSSSGCQKSGTKPGH